MRNSYQDMGSVVVAVSIEPSTHVRIALKTSKSRQQLAAACLDQPCQLRGNLYIGSKDAEQNIAALEAAGITHVLQAGVELAPSHPTGHFQYQQLVCSDTETQDIVSLFRDAFEFIDAGRKRGE
jgi:hypothetical protein